ncbi:MAG: hypothetical protein JSR82_12415 [Verrucomicrobia bacterium]|nr:hypothetical protein [Verrucomicrobiota bacterium]
MDQSQIIAAARALEAAAAEPGGSEAAVRAARKLLVQLMAEVTALRAAGPAGTTGDLSALLATLQAGLELLQTRDVLSDLADLQALSALRTELAACLRECAAAGQAPERPLDLVRHAVRARAAVVEAMLGEIAQGRAPAAALRARALHTFRAEEIEALEAQARTLQAELPARLARFAPQLDPADPNFSLDLEAPALAALREVFPELKVFLGRLSAAGADEAALRECALGRGPIFELVLSDLAWVLERCAAWPQEREAGLAELARVRSETMAGNYRTARKLFAACPKGLEGPEADAALDGQIEGWPERIRKLETALGERAAGLGRTISWSGSLSRLGLVARCEREYRQATADLDAFEAEAQRVPEGEYRREALEAAARARRQIDAPYATAQRLQSQARLIVGSAILLLLALLLAFWYLSRSEPAPPPRRAASPVLRVTPTPAPTPTPEPTPEPTPVEVPTPTPPPLRAAMFEVTAVLLGDPPAAVINGRDYSVGDLVRYGPGPDEIVKLERIEDGAVVLRQGDREIVVGIQRRRRD